MRAGAIVSGVLRSDDRLLAASNTLAAVIVGNQPFYPLYVWWIVGDDGYTSLITFLSTPFFAAVPFVGRVRSVWGRALLPLTGLFNTFVCAKAFGEASGVELFIAPCLLIAVLSFRSFERIWAAVIVGISAAASLALHGRYGEPLHVFTSEQYARYFSMNAYSVALLMLLITWKFMSSARE